MAYIVIQKISSQHYRTRCIKWTTAWKIKCSYPKVSRQNDWQDESLDQAGHCSLTGRYFQLCPVFFSFPQAKVICLRLQSLALACSVGCCCHAIGFWSPAQVQKAPFRRRTFHELNLMYVDWIKYTKSLRSESIRNTYFNLAQQFIPASLAGNFGIGATLEKLWFRCQTFYVPNLMLKWS